MNVNELIKARRMRIAAYCRVSTDKEDQLNSLEAQKKFFSEYTERTGDVLVRLYADEGLSGTRIKNRKEFLQMMSDAEQGFFDMVVVKDISRFARNTVDLLQCIRKLKALGIETQFLTANMTSMGNSEFVLTIFGALAQEESANTSKRVKFGKKINAEKGRVPNFVFGYDKKSGDYFNLNVNNAEADVVREIYRLYTVEGYGTAKIAKILNGKKIKTKRGCNWSSNSVFRILSNEIYTGRIINGKQEVTDFLTGERRKKNESEWMITVNPAVKIIEPETFVAAGKILSRRGISFKNEGERYSSKYIFSTLIKCRECGRSFRRMERKYKKVYVRWVCSARNLNGAHTCPDATSVDENELIDALKNYFMNLLNGKNNVVKYFVEKFSKVYKAKEGNSDYENAIKRDIEKLNIVRSKYMNMYTDDLITRDELNEKIGGTREKIAALENKLKITQCDKVGQIRVESILNRMFKNVESIVNVKDMTNAQLKKIVRKIEVDKYGNVDICLKIAGDFLIDSAVRNYDNRT